MEVFSPTQFNLTVDNLISIFNASMQKNVEEFNKEMSDFLNDPYNKKNSPVGGYCPSPVFQNWLKIDRKLVDEDTFFCFKNALIDAGWNVKDIYWQKDERSDEDILYVFVMK